MTVSEGRSPKKGPAQSPGYAGPKGALAGGRLDAPRSSLGCAPGRRLAGEQTKSKNHVSKKPHAGESARGSMSASFRADGRARARKLKKSPRLMRSVCRASRRLGLQRDGCITMTPHPCGVNYQATRKRIAKKAARKPSSRRIVPWSSGRNRRGSQRRGRRCPKPMPRIPAFCRSAPSVRFILFAITVSGVRAFECAWSCRTSCIVQGMR